MHLCIKMKKLLILIFFLVFASSAYAAVNVTQGSHFTTFTNDVTYVTTLNLTADQITVDGLCWNLTNNSATSQNDSFCYGFNLSLEDKILFAELSDLDCLINISAQIGVPITVNFSWLNKTNNSIKNGSTSCEHETLCTVDTLEPSLITFNDTLFCSIEVNQSDTFFTYNFTGTTAGASVGSIGVCDAVNQFPVLNLTYFDDETGININVTNSFELIFSDDLGSSFNLTGNFSDNFSDQFCTSIDPAVQIINLSVFGQIIISKEGYVTRVNQIPAVTNISVSNDPITQFPIFLINVDNSTTINFRWQTTDFQTINGIMQIYRCEENGSRVLIDSTQIADSFATANLLLFTTAYSYEVVINDIVFTDDSFTECHEENTNDRVFYVEITEIELLPVIGLFLTDCLVEPVATNIVRMTWAANPFDSSAIEACIVGKRPAITGLTEIYRNCSTAVSGSFIRTIPTNGNAYYVTGEITQGDNIGICQNQVSFFEQSGFSVSLGISGAFLVGLLIVGISLLYIGKGEEALIGGTIAIVLAFIIGFLTFPWEAVTLILGFVAMVVIIGRYTKPPQEK